MSKRRDKYKDATTGRETNREAATPRPSAAARPSTSVNENARPLTFGPETYKWMGIGFGLVLLGLILMAGSRGADYDTFDVDRLYGFRRITLAPIVILAGLGTVVFAIFKK